VWEQYDREELYEKVWERPLVKVAEEYGVSAVALGKTCRKLFVPVPGRGYWAKLAHGYAGAKKPPLPKVDKVPVIYRSPVAQKKPINSDQNDPEFARNKSATNFRCAQCAADRSYRSPALSDQTHRQPAAES
jgi:hypothetical protein